MPAKLHKKLAKHARAMGLKGERFNAYVYGTLKKYEKRKKKRAMGLRSHI